MAGQEPHANRVANIVSLLRDGRTTVVGSCDVSRDDKAALVNNLFVTDALTSNTQGPAPSVRGGDAQRRSLLATICHIGATNEGDEPTLTLAEPQGGTLDSPANVSMTSQVIPRRSALKMLHDHAISDVDTAEHLPTLAGVGQSLQRALAWFSAQLTSFREVLKSLVRSASTSTEAIDATA